MRLFFITSSYPRRRDDIAGRFVHEFAVEMVRRGHEVEVFTWQSAVREDFHDESVTVHRVPYAARRSAQNLFYGPGTPETLRAHPARAVRVVPAAGAMLAAVLARARCSGVPDRIVGHWLVPSGLLARAAGAALGCGSVVVGHSGGVHLLARLPAAARRAICAVLGVGPLTVPTRPLAAKLATLSGGALDPVVLPMGFVPPDESGGDTLRRRDWVVMGRLVPIKGVDRAIDAFAAAGLEGATLHILGDGPERARLEERAAACGAQICFHGFVRGAARDRVLGSCRFFLAPSRRMPCGRHEGLPVGLLEGASCGLVPVVAEVPGAEVVLERPALQRLEGGGATRCWARRMRRLAALDEAELRALEVASRRRARRLAWSEHGGRWERALLGDESI